MPMRTGYVVTILLLLLASEATFGQADSVKTKRKFHDSSDIRLGLGIERSVFAELGYIYSLSNRDETIIFSFYASGQVNKTVDDARFDFMFGPNAGAEAVLGAFIGGFEVKYLTTGYESQLFYTPHAGLTFEGIWSLMYGRNYPNDTSFMGQVSKHQLTFVMRIYPM